MASVPNHEGDFRQIHGNHFSGEPINRSHDPILPTPEHAVGGTPHAHDVDPSIALHPLAAHAEFLPHVDPKDVVSYGYGSSAMAGVSVKFI